MAPPAWTADFLAVDTETTGFGEGARVLEVAVVHFRMRRPVGLWFTKVLPDPEPDWNSSNVKRALEVNGLTQRALLGCPSIQEAWPCLSAALSLEPFWVGHNIEFDLDMLDKERAKVATILGAATLPRPEACFCTLSLDAMLRPTVQGSRRLDACCQRWGVVPGQHRAKDDAIAAGNVFAQQVKELQARDMEDVLSQARKALEAHRSKRAQQ